MGEHLAVESFRFQAVWQSGQKRGSQSAPLTVAILLVSSRQSAQGSETQPEHLSLGAVLVSADEQFDQLRVVAQGCGVSQRLCSWRGLGRAALATQLCAL